MLEGSGAAYGQGDRSFGAKAMREAGRATIHARTLPGDTAMPRTAPNGMTCLFCDSEESI